MNDSYENRMNKKYGFASSRDELGAEGNQELDTNSEVVVEGENLMIPISAWEAVVSQLGNIHEASQDMAEARERAAKAEVENEFLREKILNLKENLEILSKRKKGFFFR